MFVLAQSVRDRFTCVNELSKCNVSDILDITKSSLQEKVMADNLQSTGPQDRSRINIHEDWEVRYWTEALGVTREQLTELVKEVGTSANAVRQRLGK